MKVWLTAPYDPNGIKEIELCGEPNGENFSWKESGFFRTSCGWYREGYSWHRTKKAALAMAAKHRANWIAETTKKAAEVAALPSISL